VVKILEAVHVSRTFTRTDGTQTGLPSYRAGHKPMSNPHEHDDQPARHIQNGGIPFLLSSWSPPRGL
jgi:hypothetical protein